MATGNTLLLFHSKDAELPASNYPFRDFRNGHHILNFDPTTQYTCYFSSILPRIYAAGGITVYVHWACTSISNTVGWLVAFERIGDGSQDIDSDGFGSDSTVTAATVPANSGDIKITNVVITDGANIDSIAPGEGFRMRLKRDVAVDTSTGFAQLISVELKEK